MLRRTALWRGLLVIGVVFVAQPLLAASPAAAAGGGGVYAWGSNSNCQLTLATFPYGGCADRSTPASAITIGSGGGVIAVSAGRSYSLALRYDGSVLGWGDNSDYQSGNSRGSIPVVVDGLGAGTGVVAVAAGDRTSLAVKADGTVVTWGKIINSSDHNVTPVPVDGLSGVTAIAVGDECAMALLGNGTVMSWGTDICNGNGTANTTGGLPGSARSTPGVVPGLSGVVAISVGTSGSPSAGQYQSQTHNMALLADGSVLGWGYNYNGQVGDGTHYDNSIGYPQNGYNNYKYVPTPVSGLGASSGVVAVSAGAFHSVARKSDGTVLAWGLNNQGQLGLGDTTDRGVPVPLTGIGSRALEIDAGGNHNLARLSGGSVVGWGANDRGQVGTGNTATPQTTPVAVTGLSGVDVAGVSAGGSHSLAFTAPPAGTVAPTFTASTPPTQAVLGRPYSYTFAASGTPAPTIAPTTFADYYTIGDPCCHDLPPGLSFSNNVLSGTPTREGTFTYSVKATNGTYPDAYALSITLTVVSAPTFSYVGASPDAYVSIQYNATLYANGTQPITFSVDPGPGGSNPLPPGVALTSQGSGQLQGYPTTAGVYTFTLRVSNGVAPDDTRTVTITVHPKPIAPIWSQDDPPRTATVDTPYAPYAFLADGDAKPFYVRVANANNGSPLPPGLAFTPNASGTGGELKGTPTLDGTYTFHLTATNQFNQSTDSREITITVAGVPPRFTASSPPTTATVGNPYGPYTFKATRSGPNKPAQFSVVIGTLPPGLVLNLAGNGVADVGEAVLNGTPTVAGTYTFVLRASNGISPNADVTVTIIVYAHPFTYAPLSPTRVWDSRGGPGPVGKVAPGGTRDITVTGLNGVPGAGVTAVVLNVTAVNPSAGTFITAWPTGEGRPTASNLNVPAGDTRPNLVTVKVGAGGKVSFYNAAGSTDLIVDIAGWYGSARGEQYTGLTPARLWDSRGGAGPTGRVAAAETKEITVTGTGGVPATGVTAVVLNVTAVNPSKGTFVTSWPSGEGRPNASNLNVPAGDTRANLVIVKVGAGGKVSFYNDAGTTDLIADVAGYFGASGSSFVGVSPVRAWDSRSAPGPAGRVEAGGSRELTVAGVLGIPAGATSVVLNVTAVDPSSGTFVTVWPTGATKPTASNLNVPAGDTRANLVTAKVGADGKVSFFNDAGTTDLIVDIAGYYIPQPDLRAGA